jgi:hypothetical protein
MASEETLRGYLLEALARLLRHTGYRLLVHESQDRAELKQAGNGLRVRGRGADHEVDVLGNRHARRLRIICILNASAYLKPKNH